MWISPRQSRPVHPRACGEQFGSSWMYFFTDGSSPRLRGTANSNPFTHLLIRFIPAPAGNSSMLRWPPWRRAVHPRACGEQCGVAVGVTGKTGSSPRLRGTVLSIKDHLPCNRFIPAPAGNSAASGIRACRPPVHPRACGEQRCFRDSRMSAAGSSPRLRGTVKSELEYNPRLRFIPAPAGNRHTWQFVSRPISVHPRACGEQAWASFSTVFDGGSSPRLRGTGSPGGAGPT